MMIPPALINIVGRIIYKVAVPESAKHRIDDATYKVLGQLDKLTEKKSDVRSTTIAQPTSGAADRHYLLLGLFTLLIPLLFASLLAWGIWRSYVAGYGGLSFALLVALISVVHGAYKDLH